MSQSAFSPGRFARLFTSDARNVSRDPTLVFVVVMCALPALGFSWGHAPLDRWGEGAFGVTGLSLWLVPVVLALPGVLLGWLTGFLMLEDRDDGPLLAVDVSPVGKTGFLAYRLVTAMAITFALTLAAMRIVLPGAGWELALLMAVLVALQAAMAAVILPAIASNKVEGLALTKVLNIAALVPLLAGIPSAWRWLGAVLPPYWIGELAGLSGARALPVPLAAALALVVHAGVLVLLVRTLGQRHG